MSRTLDNYLQNLINKSTAQFQNALTPLVNQQLERQQQEWEDKRKGSQIADLYNARQQKKHAASGLLDKAQENYNIASSIRDYAQSTMPLKSTDEILKDLSTPKTSLLDTSLPFSMTGGQPNNDKSGSFLNRFNFNPNSFLDSSLVSQAQNDMVGKIQAQNDSAGSFLNKFKPLNVPAFSYGTDTKPQTFEEYNTNFWNEQIDTLKKLRSDFKDYEYNPVDSIEDFKENPLTANQHNIYELAKGGNMIAANELYKELYPDKQLKTRSYISPDGKSKVNEELLYYISPDGTYNEEIIKETASPYISEKDLLDYKHRQNMALADYKHNKDMEKAKFQAAAKGSKEKDNIRLTAEQLNKDLNTRKITDPMLRYALAFVNEYGTNADYNMLVQYNPNIKPVTDKIYNKLPMFDNSAEHERYNNQLKTNQEIENYFNTYHGGFDFIKNPINEDEIKKANELNITLEPTDKLNILKYYDKDTGFESDLTINQVKEILNSL